RPHTSPPERGGGGGGGGAGRRQDPLDGEPHISLDDVEPLAPGLVCLSGCARDGAVAPRGGAGRHPGGAGVGAGPHRGPTGPEPSRRGNSSHVLAAPERMAERFREHPNAVEESGRLAERLQFELTEDLGY